MNRLAETNWIIRLRDPQAHRIFFMSLTYFWIDSPTGKLLLLLGKEVVSFNVTKWKPGWKIESCTIWCRPEMVPIGIISSHCRSWFILNSWIISPLILLSVRAVSLRETLCPRECVSLVVWWDQTNVAYSRRGLTYAVERSSISDWPEYELSS